MTTEWRSQTKIGETFGFAPFRQGSVLFARFLLVFTRFLPDFARFLPHFPPFLLKTARFFCPFLSVFARFCPVCQVCSVSPKFARIRSFSFVMRMRSLPPTGYDLGQELEWDEAVLTFNLDRHSA